MSVTAYDFFSPQTLYGLVELAEQGWFSRRDEVLIVAAFDGEDMGAHQILRLTRIVEDLAKARRTYMQEELRAHLQQRDEEHLLNEADPRTEAMDAPRGGLMQERLRAHKERTQARGIANEGGRDAAPRDKGWMR